MAPAVLNRTSGEINRDAILVHGIDLHSHGADGGKRTTPAQTIESHTSSAELPSIALPDDMQDPAAFVNTPPPESAAGIDEADSRTPTPHAQISQEALRAIEPDSDFAAAQAGDPGTTMGVSRKRRRRGMGDWPLLVHVLLGIALGLGIVVAYSAYYGLPLPLP
jgi:hypothetical protein